MACHCIRITVYTVSVVDKNRGSRFEQRGSYLEVKLSNV